MANDTIDVSVRSCGSWLNSNNSKWLRVAHYHHYFTKEDFGGRAFFTFLFELFVDICIYINSYKIELRVRNAPNYELGIVRYTIYKPTNYNSITYFEYVPIALLLISCTSTYIHTPLSMIKALFILLRAVLKRMWDSHDSSHSRVVTMMTSHV
jgi:hypothetical protein